MCAGNIYGPIWNDVRARKTGRVVMEVRHQTPGDTRNARIPDVSYTSGAEELVKHGSVPQMPLLAVEVKSPDDTLKALRDKARYYLANGTRIVWLIIPEKRLVEVYTLNDEQILDVNGVLDGLEVLPGFKLPVQNVFKDTGKIRF
jgi:Uma2 family endonuclease